MSNTDKRIIMLLGAEKQVASSLALAFQQHEFFFISDQDIIDGWDLSNVKVIKASVGQLPGEIKSDDSLRILLCPRWMDCISTEPLNILGSFDLLTVMNYLADIFPHYVLNVSESPIDDSAWILKGNYWHRPDSAVIGLTKHDYVPDDIYKCGNVFQSYMENSRHVIAVGHRSSNDNIVLTVAEVYREALAREDFLLAGETIQHEGVTDLTLNMLQKLGHKGYFTLNWLLINNSFQLSSIRPVPKSVFKVLGKCGFDPGNAGIMKTRVAPQGIRFLFEPHYTHYEKL